MTNFGEHYNEELAQQEIEINKKTLREMVGAFIVLTAGDRFKFCVNVKN